MIANEFLYMASKFQLNSSNRVHTRPLAVDLLRNRFNSAFQFGGNRATNLRDNGDFGLRQEQRFVRGAKIENVISQKRLKLLP